MRRFGVERGCAKLKKIKESTVLSGHLQGDRSKATICDQGTRLLEEAISAGNLNREREEGNRR
jgi:hypothetical protein